MSTIFKFSLYTRRPSSIESSHTGNTNLNLEGQDKFLKKILHLLFTQKYFMVV